MDKIFPKWNPQRSTLRRLESDKFSIRFKALRNSSNCFISRKDVRDYIFCRDGFRCTICGSTEYLQIDHIRSIYRAAKERKNIMSVNDEDNLRVACLHCNSSKAPEE